MCVHEQWISLVSRRQTSTYDDLCARLVLALESARESEATCGRAVVTHIDIFSGSWVVGVHAPAHKPTTPQRKPAEAQSRPKPQILDQILEANEDGCRFLPAGISAHLLGSTCHS